MVVVFELRAAAAMFPIDDGFVRRSLLDLLQKEDEDENKNDCFSQTCFCRAGEKRVFVVCAYICVECIDENTSSCHSYLSSRYNAQLSSKSLMKYIISISTYLPPSILRMTNLATFSNTRNATPTIIRTPAERIHVAATVASAASGLKASGLLC